MLGFLKILKNVNIKIDKLIDKNGLLKIPVLQKKNDGVKNIFKKWKELTKEAGYTWGGKKGYYANQTENSIKRRIDALFLNMSSGKRQSQIFVCSFCGKKFQGSKTALSFIDQSFGNLLMSTRTTPNFFWALEKDLFCCPECEFILMCHHLAFTKLSDGSEIFINAASFKEMWYLNKFLNEVYAKNGVKSKRELLGMTIIEYATKIQLTLGLWVSMNIELISKHRECTERNKFKDYIEFFSIPYQTIKLLSDSEIAELLSNIGEFKVFNAVLDEKYHSLLENSYRLLKIALKMPNERNRSEEMFLNSYLRLERNKRNVLQTIHKILKLYALIEQKLNREV